RRSELPRSRQGHGHQPGHRGIALALRVREVEAVADREGSRTMSRVDEDGGDDRGTSAAVVQFLRSGMTAMPAGVDARLRASLHGADQAAAGMAREPRPLAS